MTFHQQRSLTNVLCCCVAVFVMCVAGVQGATLIFNVELIDVMEGMPDPTKE